MISKKIKLLTFIMVVATLSATACGKKDDIDMPDATVTETTIVDDTETEAVMSDGMVTKEESVSEDPVLEEEPPELVFTMLELGTFNEGDILKVWDVVDDYYQLDYSMYFLLGDEKEKKVTVTEEACEFLLVVEDDFGNRVEETITVDVYVNPFKYSELNPKNHCTYDVEYSRNEEGEVVSVSTYTVSREFRDMIYELVPELLDFPEEWQEKQFKNCASQASWYESEEQVIEDFRDSCDVYYYYSYHYDEEYGDVKGYRRGTGLAMIEKEVPGTEISFEEKTLDEMTLEEIEYVMEHFNGADYDTDEEARAAFGAIMEAYYDKYEPEYNYYELYGDGGIVTGGDDGRVDENGWFDSSTVTFVYKADRDVYITLKFISTGEYDDLGRALYTLEDYCGLEGIVGLEGDQYAVMPITFVNITARGRGYQGPIKWR